MLLRTDDAPRRLRAVWLGPAGTRWWVTWTYVQWAVFAGLMMLCAGLIFLILLPVNPGLGAMACVPWGGMASWGLTRWVMTRVDYDRPLRYWRIVLRSQRRHSRRIRGASRVRVVPPSAVALSPEVAGALHTSRTTRPRRHVGLVDL